MDKLKELLDGLVAEKSLSFDVLEQLRKVKTESEELVKVNLLFGESIKEKDKVNANLMAEVAKLGAEIVAWKAREDSLTTREKAVLDIEHKNEVEKMKAEHAFSTLNQIKEVVGMVFKNTVLKKTTLSNNYHSTPQGSFSESVNGSEEVKEE